MTFKRCVAGPKHDNLQCVSGRVRHGQVPPKKHKQNNTKKESIKWPNYVIYEGNVIYASLKEPNYAIYMLPAGQMNRRLVLSRTTYLNHLRYGNKNDYTWEGINKSYPHPKPTTPKNTYN